MKTLHIIEPTFDFGTINDTSVLLTSTDVDFACHEYHTSIGDVSASDIIKISKHFSVINFVDKKFDKASNIYKETIVLLNYLCSFKTVTYYSLKNVTNFIKQPTVSFADAKIRSRPDRSVLWVFGCSHSQGTGLLPEQLSFGEIVAEKLNLPLMLVSKVGSSLNWSTRNLVAADIRPEDTVIWQITAPHRISCYNGIEVEEIMLSRTKDRHLLDVYNDEQVFFNHFNLLNFGTRYLRTIGVKFVMNEFPPKKEYLYDYITEYTKYPEYCYTPDCNLDLASDNIHFGHLSHRAIALRLIDHLQCLYD